MWVSPGSSRFALGAMRPAGTDHAARFRRRPVPGEPGWQWQPPAAERHQGTEGRETHAHHAGNRAFPSLPAGVGWDGTLPAEPLGAGAGSLRQPGSALLVILSKARTQMTGKLAGLQVRLLHSQSNSKEKVSGAIGWFRQRGREIPAQIPAFVSSFPPCMSLFTGTSIDGRARPVHKVVLLT